MARRYLPRYPMVHPNPRTRRTRQSVGRVFQRRLNPCLYFIYYFGWVQVEPAAADGSTDGPTAWAQGSASEQRSILGELRQGSSGEGANADVGVEEEVVVSEGASTRAITSTARA